MAEEFGFKGTLRVKRIYDLREPDDGCRILVDRLWPRGESKEKADLDAWEKQVAPTTELRKAFHEKEDSYRQFMEAYKRELFENPDYASFADMVRSKLREGNVTLLYASKDREHNNADVLKEMLAKTLGLSKE